MGDVKIYKNIELNNPVMIAGWPGMGSVALGVVDYLRRKIGAVKFAEITVDRLSALDSVVVKNGLASLPATPKNTFYYRKNPDIIIFEGALQAHGRNGIILLNQVLTMALRLNVRRIFTGAAYPIPVSHKEEAGIYCAANDKALREFITKLDVHSMDEGHISGLNGILLGFAGERGIGAACLLATIPQYAISLPSPKASAAIIKLLSRMLNFEINTMELDEFSRDMDVKMALIEDRVKDVFIEDKAPEVPVIEKKVPPAVIEKIEKLFGEAKMDRSKASILKRELDRWDLYKLHEDRFLDLFREGLS